MPSAKLILTARLIALIYNWWSIYIKLVDPLVAREAIPSSPMYLIAHILLHHQTIGAGKIRAPPALGAAA